MKVSSPAFEEGDRIPEKYTCDGDDVSPLLSIDSVPQDAESLALIVDDPDAPGGTFVHWVIWNIPATFDRIIEDVPSQKTVPSLDNASQGTNDFNVIGYRGPCPPSGPAHRYRFQLYALNKSLDLSPGATKRNLQNAMENSTLAQDTLTGTYSR